MKTTLFAQLILFFTVLLWQPALAQTSLPGCTASLADHDDDGVAAAADIDKDNDGLIEICDIEGINEMRYQLDGSGYTTSTDAVKITQGCPTTGCNGYELMRSLDFNVADSYRDNTIDTAWTTSTGWQPIGSNANRFRAIFNGNGHTIANLYMKNNGIVDGGLFSVLHSNGRIQNIGLLDADIEWESNISRTHVGGLVGDNEGTIINSYVTGNVTSIGGLERVGGLVAFNEGTIINSYVNGNVTGLNVFRMGGLVGDNEGTIINSYATGAQIRVDRVLDNLGGLVGHNRGNIVHSYAAGVITGTGGNVGGLVSRNSGGRVIASYWDTSTSRIMTSAAGVGKSTTELQSPAASTGIYSGWSSSDWNFGDSADYPTLRYAKGGNLNACATDITTSSTALPCGISLPNQSNRNKGLAGVFFFADGEPASVVLEPLFHPLRYNYDMTIVAVDLDIQLRPYALNNNANITITDHNNRNYFAAKPNAVLSDAISLEANETTLTIVITDTIDDNLVNTTYTFVIVRLLPFRIDGSPSRLRVIFEPATPDADGDGSFSYQWQQQMPGVGWINVAGATTATYWLSAAANSSVRYRVNIKHTDGEGYETIYPPQGLFRPSVDDDGDGLIDIYFLEDLDAIRYQLNGLAYQSDENADPIMRGCPTTGCRGYELMRSLDFNVADSYQDNTINIAWLINAGWQPIGSNANHFSGIFEGNGHTIRNLRINRTEANLGLFSVLHRNGRIQHVGLLESTVAGTQDNRGSLVGRIDGGSIISSYATGNVTGSFSSNIGGLVGRNDGGSIINSYATGNVTGLGSDIGGLVGYNVGGSIINSYATGNVTNISGFYVGGLVGENDSGSIINSYATGNVTNRNGFYDGGLVGYNVGGSIINSYAMGVIAGGSNIGGLVASIGGVGSRVIASYWDTETSGIMNSAAGVGKTSTELKSPTIATGIYRDWSTENWDFGDSNHYPALRYVKGGNLNACTTDITISSTASPCGLLLPDQNVRDRGLAEVFFFADGEQASVVSDPLFYHLDYNYDMLIATPGLNIQLRPYALNNNAKITISDHNNRNYFADKPNAAVSDPISLEANETTLTIVITDTIDDNPVNTTYTFVIVRLLPLMVDVSSSRLRVILEPATPDPDGGGLSYQWQQQQQQSGLGWSNIAAATTTTYSLPPDADGSIRYRVNIKHIDGGGYITDYPVQGPFRISVDDDGDGLIDIYTLEDLDAMRYQLDGRTYRLNESAEPNMRGCPAAGCRGYELMRSLDFNADTSYHTTANKAIWTAASGWPPIGSDANRFSSLFEGNGYTIANLFMNRAGPNLGLFSVLRGNSRIQDVGLLDVNVEGDRDNIGGLVGINHGSITNSYATGTVRGTGVRYIGGLVGYNNGGRIINSHATGTVSGNIGVGGLVGHNNRGAIINSYATASVLGKESAGGLVGVIIRSTIINSYATGSVTEDIYVGGLVGRINGFQVSHITNSYATGTVSSVGSVGGLVGDINNNVRVTASYWDGTKNPQLMGAVGTSKTTAELKLPTAPTGIYSNWSGSDWDFGDSDHYPILRYAKGGNLNACATDITTSSEALPCGIVLLNPSDSDRNQGLAGLFFFADDKVASTVLEPLFSQGIDHYDMTIVAADLAIHLRPYALNNNAKITISDHNSRNYFADKPNAALSDPISLEANETTLTIVITDTIDDNPVNTTYTFVIVRWLPFRMDINPSRLRVILEPATPDPDGGGFSYQWQQRKPGVDWSNIAGATTATYWLPPDADGSTRYRLVMKHIDGEGYITDYPDQGPYRLSVDDDGDGLIDIYTLEDLDAMRYQLNGRAYRLNESAEPNMRGCPAAGCRGYELVRSLDFAADTSYHTTANKAIWTAASGWQPIGSDANRFSSLFEGNGHTIRNLLMNQAEPRLGLFSVLHGNGQIQNVGLLDVNIEGDRDNIGGLVSISHGSIINSYVTGTVSGTGDASSIGGLLGVNRGRVINSYATVDVSGNTSMGGLAGANFNVIMNSYALGQVSGRGNNIGGLVGHNDSGSIINSYALGQVNGDGSDIGGLVGANSGSVTASYWDKTKNPQLMSAVGTSKTTAELQLPTAPTGIYSDWSSSDWDFGTTSTYPALRYAKGGNLNACITEITTSSVTLPCGISLPNQDDRNQGLAGVFFFADGEQASVVSDPLFSQGIYHYAMTIVAADLDIQLRPYALNDNAKITISDHNSRNYFADKPNAALSDAISLEANETILTIVITDTIDDNSVNTTYTYVIVRWLPFRMDINRSRLSLIFEPATPDPDGGGFSYQWQQQVPGIGWTNIAGATTATYWLPPDANGSIRYRLINMKHTDGGGYITSYPDQGPFRTSVDDDGDGLIDIYTLEDLDAIRYQLNGRAYQPSESATPLMRGCPVAGCSGYELMRSLDFNANTSYRIISNKALWTTGVGWQPIGSNDNRFSSLLEGNGHTIRNLHMDRAEPRLSLFSVSHANSRIQNVGLLDVDIEGMRSNISALVGANHGAIINSYATGTVSGIGTVNYIGGLVGVNRGRVINSYAMVDVSGNMSTGGLAGGNFNVIMNSYALGQVAGRGNHIGGLIGYHVSGSITNSYALGQVSSDGDDIGGLVGRNQRAIINSYAMGRVTGNERVGGLVGRNQRSITNSYATGMVSGDSDVGGLVGAITGDGSVTASYWDKTKNPQLMSAVGTSKTTAELQSPTAPGTTPTEVYYGWDGSDWDFGGSDHYPALRYVKGNNLNACITDITASSTALPCTILLPDQNGRNQGLAGVFFFADGKVAPVILARLFSQGIYHYDMIISSRQDMQLRPYAINDNAMITITDQNGSHYFPPNRSNRALSDMIRWQGNQSTLTIVVTDIIDETTTDTTYTFAATRVMPPVVTEISINPSGVIDEGSNTTITFIVNGGLGDYEYAYELDGQPLSAPSQPSLSFTIPSNLVDSDRTTQTIEVKIVVSDDIQVVEHPLVLTVRKVDNGDDFSLSFAVNGSRLSAIFAGTDVDGEGIVSYQWQQLELGGEWTNIAAATTATYDLPNDTDGTIRYRVNVQHTDGQGYVTHYQQGPFRVGDLDNDNDGLIEIYYLEDVAAIHYQLDGSGYQTSVAAAASRQGCPVSGCNGYELMRHLDFNNDADYSAISNKMIWTTASGWQPIGTRDDPFSSVFEGNGYTLFNLQINRSDSDIGLFSALHADGEIKNVGLLDVAVQGDDNVGSLVGENNGSIINSYATGTVSGTSNIGGLVGWNTDTGLMLSSFANAEVSGNNSVGGLVGENEGRIANTYAAGTVAITVDADQTLGGLVGNNTGSITNSYTFGSVLPGLESASALQAGGLVGITTGSASVISASYWDSTVNASLTMSANAKTIIELQSPTAPGTTTTEVYYGWSSNDWDFGDNSHYPRLRYARGDDLNACNSDITTPSAMLACAVPLPNQRDRSQGLNALFVLADGDDVTADLVPTFFPLKSSYNTIIVTTETAVQLTLRPYAINDNAMITITDQDNTDYFAGKPNGALSESIVLSEPITLTLTVTDTINEAPVNTTYTFAIKRTTPLEVNAITLSSDPATPIDEGDTITLTVDVSGGSGTYEYTYLLDGQPLLSPSSFEFTLATDVIAGATTTQTFTLQIRVSDSDGQIFEHNEDLTIRKVDNGDPVITSDITARYLRILVGEPDPDGDGEFSLKWQSQMLSGGEWMDIVGATTATYWLPATDSSMYRYRAVNIRYTDGQGFVKEYANQGPFLGETMLQGDISIEGPADEGDTLTLTAPTVSGGSGEYHYEWTQTAEDSTQLSGHSALILTNTNTATVNAQIPADFIALASTSAKITFKVVVIDGEFTTSQSKTVTIHKIDNSLADIVTTEVNAILTVTVTPDPDGNATNPNYMYQWQQRTPEQGSLWQAIDTATAATYRVPGDTPINTRFRVLVTYTDGQGYRKTVASNELQYIAQSLSETMLMGDISIEGPVNEGSTFTLTAPTVSGGSGEYNYEWMQTAEDSMQLSGHSALILTNTNTATVNAQIPADFIASAATSANITFKVVVDDGLTMTSRSKVVTINKIDNGLADIAITEVNGTLSVTVNPNSDPDGNATDPNYTYQWQQRAPEADSPWMDINAATAATYRVPNETLTHFRVLVTYTDGQEYREIVTSNEIEYIAPTQGIKIRTRVFLEGPLR